MKFNSLFRVCLIFYTYDSTRTSKSIGNIPWKNATRYCAGPAYYRMCSTDVYCSKQTGGSSTKETITHHFFVSTVRPKKTVDAAKFVAAQKMLKQENQQTFVMDCSVYYFRHLYSAGSACVLLAIITWVAHRYGQLYLHCSLIYFWVPSSCFCIVISLSLRVK